jgi:hypothetical protein
MKSDLYTKVVLTVIAVSLLWLCVQNTVNPTTVAAQGIQRVSIVGSEGLPLPVIVQQPGSEPLVVKIQQPQPLAVNISSISAGLPYSSGVLPVRVRQQVSDPPVPVNISSISSFAIPITGSVGIDGGHVAIDGPVTVRQATPKTAPAAPSKK